VPAAYARVGGLLSKELLAAVRYLPPGMRAYRITTRDLLAAALPEEDDLEWLSGRTFLKLGAARWSDTGGDHEQVTISLTMGDGEAAGTEARLRLDDPARGEALLDIHPRRVGQEGDVLLFEMPSSSQVLRYGAEIGSLSLRASSLAILREAVQGRGSLDAVLACAAFPRLGPGAELLAVVRVGEQGVRGFATYGHTTDSATILVAIDADDVPAAREYLLETFWGEDIREHARPTEQGMVVSTPPREARGLPEGLLWHFRVQALSHILWIDDL